MIYISIAYYFLANSIYLFLLGASVVFLQRQMRIKPLIEALTEDFPAFAPPVSILAPAYNEQASIVASVQSFLMLTYPTFEVVVINDGSSDHTMDKLKEAFFLEPIEFSLDGLLSKTKVYEVWRSKLHPNLVVVDKANGGKADALNIGIEVAQFEIFCAVDSDSLLESDSLQRVVTPFLEDPTTTIAAGGTVRIANGSTVRFGRVEKVGLSDNWIVLMQVVEYTRAFLCGRIGWNVMNATLVISGAFGCFSKRAVMSVGGYKAGSIGEDMELVMRLHEYHRREKIPYRVVFVPDPVCWTEAPETLASLKKQRNRWQRGLADSITQHWTMILNPRFGFLGLLALPYFIMVELFGPAIELGSLGYVLWRLYRGEGDPRLVLLFFVASLLYGLVMSVAAVLVEEIYFSKYNRVKQFLTLLLVCTVESLGYKQMSSLWRVVGLISFMRGDHSWGQQQRLGFSAKR